MEKRKKVAVMTWFSHENYGSVLQAVALCRAIEFLGFDAKLIDYPPRPFRAVPERRSAAQLLLKAAKKLRHVDAQRYSPPERSGLFASFVRDNASLTDACPTYPELCALQASFDAFVCGSDQIWSPLCFDRNYFLPFVRDGRKRIAYAPSFGVARIGDPIVREQMAQLLHGFGHLSSRETQGAAIVEDLAGRRPQIVLDPTLLLGPEEWTDLLRLAPGFLPGLPTEGYLLCYFLGEPKAYAAQVSNIAAKLGLPVVCVPLWREQLSCAQPSCAIGPSEFVQLFRDASYVCTDSFHGVVFSTNFNVGFTAFKRFDDSDEKSQNSRIASFLDATSLSARLQERDAISEHRAVDFSQANRIVRAMRSSSLEYLERSLSEAASCKAEPTVSAPMTIAESCCGCGACAAVCPCDAVSIQLDQEGFQSYRIDDGRCIRCGACLRVCPFVSVRAPSLRSAVGLYSYKSADADALFRSSSGGFGGAAAAQVAAEGYEVYGCVYRSSADSAEHVKVSPDRIGELRGSKYVQSRTEEAVREIARSSKGNRLAFFGTPCQVAGVDALLRARGERDRAVLIDLVCLGVPSSFLWERYLADRRTLQGVGPHPEVVFRDKRTGWRPKRITLEGTGGSCSTDERHDDFFAFFNRGLCNARACGECPYRERSAADVRMGDYWGPRFEKDETGVSMVIVSTSRGEALLESMRKCMAARFDEQDLGEYWDVQQPCNCGAPLERRDVIEDLQLGIEPLHRLRLRHCAAYDQQDAIARAKTVVKSMVGRG